MMEEGIHQGAAAVAGCRMHHHACGFLQNQKVLILEQHVQPGRLGRRHGRLGIGNMHGKALARFDPGGPVRYLSSVAADSAFGHQSLEASAGKVREPDGQEFVDPLAGIVRFRGGGKFFGHVRSKVGTPAKGGGISAGRNR